MQRFTSSGRFNARRLHFLQAIAYSGGIRAAAELLEVNPSVVSREIARLERDHDSALLEKQGRGVVLTAMGELLAAHYRDQIQREQEVIERIEDHTQLRRGKITLALGEGYTHRLLSGGLKGFMARYPTVFIELVTGSTHDIIESTLGGRAEIGVCAGHCHDPGLRVHLFSGGSLCAVMAPDHPLAVATTLTLRELEGQRLICMQEHFAVQQHLRRMAQHEGMVLSPDCYCDLFSVALTLAIEKVGITFMTATAARQAIDQAQLVAIPLKQVVAFQHQLLTRTGHRLTPAARYLYQHLITALGREELRCLSEDPTAMIPV